MEKYCFECGRLASEEHHVIPESLGGTKTIPLCGGCHALVHGGYNKRRDDHVELTKLGLQRAKERGVVLGNPRLGECRHLASEIIKEGALEFAKSVETEVHKAIEEGGSYSKAAEILNVKGVSTSRGGKWSSSQICRILARLKFSDTPLQVV